VAKAVGRKTLRTERDILTGIAENMLPEMSSKDIVSKHVTDSL